MRLVMDRLAVRFAAVLGEAVLLKGGLALELRMQEARATKDIDLHLVGSPDHALERLQAAGRLALPDHLQYELEPDPRHPRIDAEGMRYEGMRFRAQGRLAGKVYGGRFGIDVAFAEPTVGGAEVVAGTDLLSFAGVEPGELRIYPIETHIAETLHAYTLPRKRPNSRVKDLPDLALLARIRSLDAGVLRTAIHATFSHRAVHPIPVALPAPPENWEAAYARMVERDALQWRDLNTLYGAVCAFLDPLLSGGSGTWSPDAWAWEP
ncbi:MAG: hypothetical protein ACI9K2_006901 [Myxococcota bacterium]|jgi:hypothetical protein